MTMLRQPFKLLNYKHSPDFTLTEGDLLRFKKLPNTKFVNIEGVLDKDLWTFLSKYESRTKDDSYLQLLFDHFADSVSLMYLGYTKLTYHHSRIENRAVWGKFLCTDTNQVFWIKDINIYGLLTYFNQP